jgi:hypothetical protein
MAMHKFATGTKKVKNRDKAIETDEEGKSSLAVPGLKSEVRR